MFFNNSSFYLFLDPIRCDCDEECQFDVLKLRGSARLRLWGERLVEYADPGSKELMKKALDTHEAIALPLAPPGLRSVATSPIQWIADSTEPRRKIPRRNESSMDMLVDDDVPELASPHDMMMNDDFFGDNFPSYSPTPASIRSLSSPNPSLLSININSNGMPNVDNEPASSQPAPAPLPSRDNGNGMPKIVDDFSKCLKCNEVATPAVRCQSCLGSYHWDFECAGDGFNGDDSEYLCSSCMEYFVSNDIETETIVNFTNSNINTAKKLVRQHLGSSEELQNVLSSFSPYYRFVRETMDINEDYVFVAGCEDVEIEEIEIDELPRPPREPAPPLNDDDFGKMIDRGDMTDEQYALALELLRYKASLPQDEEEEIGEWLI